MEITPAAILAGLFGLFVGSFVNVLIYRIPRGEEWVKTPSHCAACGQRLVWYELVPVVSWLMLRGKCRICGLPISPRYPAVELFQALLWLVCAQVFGQIVFLAVALMLSTCLLALSVIDWKTKEIPDGFALVLLAAGLLWNGYLFSIGIGFPVGNLTGFFAGSLPLLLIAILTKGGMGGGDIKLMAVCGLLLGWRKILLALGLAAVLGTIIMLPIHIVQKKERRAEVPFGPFLSAGIFLAMCFGEELLGWYISLF